MSAYDVEKMTFSDLNGKINLPTYQRPVVWTESEKLNFINSLHKGFPFGSLLLYRYGDDFEKYTLIDGQQRFTTMLNYSERPYDFFPVGSYDYVERCITICGAQNQSPDSQSELESQFRKIIEALLKKLVESGKKLSVMFLRDEVRKVYPLVRDDSQACDNLIALQQEITQEFDNYLDLNSIIIPCVIFRGEESDLPDVFASVNLGGRKLTKYQVFSAQWNKYSVELPKTDQSSRVLDNVISRYESLTDDRGGLEIEDFDAEEMRKTRTVSLPEFCHSLGQEILRCCPACWSAKTMDLDDAVDTIGYNSLAIVFGIKPQDINRLAKEYHDSGLEEAPGMVDRLIDSILTEYKAINNQFARHLRKPGEANQGSTPNCFENGKALGQLQFLSFFAALWRIRYGFDTIRVEPKPGYDKAEYKRTRQCLFGSYLIDLLTGQWKGSGDSRLASYIDGSRTYLASLNEGALHGALTSWLEQEKSTPSINIDTETKILITVFASSTPADYKSQSYDFEHIIARKVLNKKDGDIQLYRALNIPGGRLGNIMLLSSSQNRSKHEKNLGMAAGEELQIISDRNYLPSKRELNDIEFDLRDGSSDKFMKMFDYRSKCIISDIEKAILPPS